jgi:hypothetical protein
LLCFVHLPLKKVVSVFVRFRAPPASTMPQGLHTLGLLSRPGNVTLWCWWYAGGARRQVHAVTVPARNLRHENLETRLTALPAANPGTE